MRAPVQKTRPRRPGKQTPSPGGAEPTPGRPTPGGLTPGTTPDAAPAGKGRPTRVRNRLIVAVAVVAAAVAGAGAPSVVDASGHLHDAQELVVLAEQTEDALTLAHSLADERDEVTSYIAAGRPESRAPSEQRSVRVDRQIEELRADSDTPASLRDDLDGIAALRREALTGRSTALEAHDSYSATLTELHRLAERLAERMPADAGSGALAQAELDSAVQQAAAARGLLVAALSVPTTTETVIDPVTGVASTRETSSDADAEQRDALSAAAQLARVRSDAALAGFRDTAPGSARTAYDSTVTGPDIDTAEKYLASLTDEATLSERDLATDTRRVEAALTTRVDLMRGAESALYDRRTKTLERLRDDDVTSLEIRIAVLGALMLLAVGVATGMARGLTRPLAVLRLGSARLARAEDPAAEEPVGFTGRRDEFAQVVDSVNALHAQAVAVRGRLTTLESDRKHLVAQRQRMAEAREELRTELTEAAARLERLRGSVQGTSVSLALRTLGLVERQLAVIEGLEESEQDPDRLATLYKLDHLATVMRRHSENLLVLAGAEHGQQHAGPVPLVDVVRAAVSEIERYERVRITALPRHVHVAGFAADDLSHLLAELMENATSFSPPDLPVEISGWLLESGEVMLSVQDEGIGMTGDRLTCLNSRLTDFDPEDPYSPSHSPSHSPSNGSPNGQVDDGGGLGLGLYVVARLARRHGVRVRLREQKQGGTAAVAVLPKGLLAPSPAAAVPSRSPHRTGTPAASLPGADSEANSNVLHGRVKSGDPLVDLAERAVRETAAAAKAVRETAKRQPPGAPEAEREHPAETTMELLIPARPAAPATGGTAPGEPSTAAGPRTGDPAAEPAAAEPAAAEPAAAEPAAAEPAAGEADAGEADAEHARTPDEESLTDKGLPKRTPKITASAQAPRPRAGGVDADALRRRLGGFRRGAEAGYRDVQAEIAEQTGRNEAPTAMGDPAEEAGS